MQVFHFHPDTGLYLGDGMADPSPLEPGVFLVPAHATTIAPPVVAEGEQAIWAGEAWSVEPIPEPEAPEPPPAPPSPQPDYVSFLDTLIGSTFYQKVLQQASAAPPINVAFTAATGALVLAAAGQPNLGGIQSGINALLGLMTLEVTDIEEIQEMLDASYLGELIQLAEV